MKEARLIVPAYLNDGVTPTHTIRAEVETRLAKEFGGFTATAGSGGWHDGDKLINEPVVVYDVAAKAHDRKVSDKLKSIAFYVMDEAKQEAVYVRLPDGNVEILKSHKIKPAAAA